LTQTTTNELQLAKADWVELPLENWTYQKPNPQPPRSIRTKMV